MVCRPAQGAVAIIDRGPLLDACCREFQEQSALWCPILVGSVLFQDMPYKMPDRKLLVTGATGYIGYRLLAHVREYLSAEFVPTALVRPTSCTIDLKRLLDYPQSLSDSSVRVADILDVSSLHDAVRGITHVVHLAADMDFFPEDPGRLTRTNVEGTRNLLQACATEASRSKMPLRFVYISSTEAIGPVDDLGRPGSEMDPCQPDCQYGISKAMAEDVVREFSSQLQCCILRVTGVYGPGERFFFHEFAAMTESGLLLVTPGPLDGCLMMSHIEDVISAIKLALLRDEATNQCYIVAPDDCYSYKELARILAESFRRSPPMITVPLSVVKVIVRVLMPLLNYGKKRIFMIVSILSLHRLIPF